MFNINYIFIGIIVLAVIVVLFLIIMILKSSKSKKKIDIPVADVSKTIPEFSEISQSSDFHFSEQDFNRRLMSEQQGVESIVGNMVQPDVEIISDSDIVQQPVELNVIPDVQQSIDSNVQDVFSSSEGPGFIPSSDFNFVPNNAQQPVVSNNTEQQSVSNESGVAAFDNFFSQPVLDNPVVQDDAPEPEIIDDI